MNEHPIIFNGDMVRAVLSGRKTQTRRPVKFMKRPPAVSKDPRNYGELMATTDTWFFGDTGAYARCPFGVVGDRLWVRETWKPILHSPGYDNGTTEGGSEDFEEGVCIIQYQADSSVRTFDDLDDDMDLQVGPVSKIRPSIHLPRWASRITLEVCDIKAERLQHITWAAAIAEGCTGDFCYQTEETIESPEEQFLREWKSIYPDNQEKNPWVWVVGFRKLEGVSAP